MQDFQQHSLQGEGHPVAGLSYPVVFRVPLPLSMCQVSVATDTQALLQTTWIKASLAAGLMICRRSVPLQK